ncbi:MAG TPA: GlsB/YeaQ/YmgE family stress response membrane protein [Bradyrhizobium sp.]|nr:GlsB/YeaQ/YmgE family stress response membrane protein [Bradyrhizobium sp.]
MIAGVSIVAGALVAAWLLPRLGFSVGPTLIRNIINATIGAAIVMAVLAVIRRG